MLKAIVYNQKGEKTGFLELNPRIFGLSENSNLVHQAVLYQMALKRVPSASTKTRAEVRGGGKKPWRQKGTGRARAGSIRSPLWRGGGVVFGPSKERVFKKEMPKKMRKLALFSVLSNKLKTNKIVLLDKLEFKNIKTKQVEEMLNKLPIKEGTILYVYNKIEPQTELSCRNLPYLKTLSVEALNPVDVLKYDWLLITKETIKKIEEIYLKNKKDEKEKESKDKRKEVNGRSA